MLDKLGWMGALDTLEVLLAKETCGSLVALTEEPTDMPCVLLLAMTDVPLTKGSFSSIVMTAGLVDIMGAEREGSTVQISCISTHQITSSPDTDCVLTVEMAEPTSLEISAVKMKRTVF